MTRGYKLNSPLYIEVSNFKPFKGEERPSKDPRYATFKSIEYGYRAAFKMLHAWQQKLGFTRLLEFIEQWCPASEYDTHWIVDQVCMRTHLADVSTVDTKNKLQMCKIVAAMSYIKNQTEPNEEDIKNGWRLFTASM